MRNNVLTTFPPALSRFLDCVRQKFDSILIRFESQMQIVPVLRTSYRSLTPPTNQLNHQPTNQTTNQPPNHHHLITIKKRIPEKKNRKSKTDQE